MTEDSKSANNNGSGNQASAAKPKLSANVSVLKAKPKAESPKNEAKPRAEAKIAAKKTDKATVAKQEGKKNIEQGSEDTAKKFSTNTIKEKTMAKSTNNSNSNINVPFDSFAKEAAEISRDYSEACVKSGTIFMKGMEDFVGVVMALAQSSAEKQAQFIKEAMSSKTINEFAEVQNKIAQANFDDFMAGATKLTEISTKLITESAEPVNAQIGKAIKKASQSLAA
ncbi:MAG: TIGR01841 family phasin [Alphaproteobacteria bacterium]|nr:TIGR01841 family phasin [Alphaproteobacteria bacterium]MBP7758626.1 TIGR01841 family phasin [Alphaproteobacteria bacterium]MBP7763371.1 TIGR01841 family phasin [Alphaproteobacteria bacterium]MBP7904970.1 TIGR01841 family phasin [Alphaproteobacteria bacterium]